MAFFGNERDKGASRETNDPLTDALFSPSLTLTLDRILQMNGTRAAPAILQLTHDLFDHFSSDIAPDEMRAIMEDQGCHCVQRLIAAACMNEILRRGGPESPMYGCAVEAYAESEPGSETLHAVALQGLFDRKAVDVCRQKIADCRDLRPEGGKLESLHTAIRLLMSFRQEGGLIEESASGVLLDAAATRRDFSDELCDALRAVAAALKVCEDPERYYLEACQEILKQKPELQYFGETPASTDSLPEQCLLSGIGIVDRWQEPAMEGAAMLASAWGDRPGGGEQAMSMEVLASGAERPSVRLVYASRLSGSKLLNYDPLIDSLIGNELDSAILSAVALWNPGMDADLKRELQIIMTNPCVDAYSAALAAYVLGSARDPDISERIFSDKPGMREKVVSAVRYAYKAAQYTGFSERVRVFADFLSRGTRKIDFLPVRYRGFAAGGRGFLS